MADEDPSPDTHDAQAYTQRKVRESWLLRRQRKIREEIARNRRGEYRVPTWVLAVILVAVLAAWALWIFLA
jgi:hypothetical protein